MCGPALQRPGGCSTWREVTSGPKGESALARIGELEAQLAATTAERDQLRAAIKPFARAGAEIPSHWLDETSAVRWTPGKHAWFLTVGDFRGAAAAHGSAPSTQPEGASL
jgi:hypothetical protein